MRIITGASDNTIGGLSPAARNVISSNAYGVEIDSGATNNYVQGNYIGTDHSGSVALGNQYYGVLIDDAPQNFIGGTAAEARNVISATQEFGGVAIFLEGSTANVVRGNYIGTDASGSVALGNTFGVLLGRAVAISLS